MTTNTTEENKCKIVSSRGLMFSCDKFPNNPVSDTFKIDDTDYQNIQKGDTVYVILSCLPVFMNTILPTIENPFVLVTGDSDRSAPQDIFMNCEAYWKEHIMENEKILHWFTQNYDLHYKVDKITSIPIGLDYHTLKNNKDHKWGPYNKPLEQEKQLLEIRNESPKFLDNSRNGKLCLTNVNIYNKSRHDFIQNLQKINAIGFVNFTRTNRKEYWNTHKESKFVLSPRGNGLDCHRTWEALALNTIPIIDTITLKEMYEDLPVVCITNWKDLSVDFLNKAIHEISQKTLNMNKILLSYWMNKIKEKTGNVSN